MEDEEFEVAVLVRVRSIGLPQNHRSNIIDRIAREMHLAFKGNARIDEIEQSHESLAYGGPNVWVFPAPVVSQEVQRVHPKQEVSQVQGNWTTGGGT